MLMSEIVGALPDEVAVMNSLTVNLHLMMVSFYCPTPQRFKILIEEGAFPSDLYAVQSQIKFHDLDVEKALVQIQPRQGESTLRTEDIISTINQQGSELALVMLSGIQYYTGQFFDIPAITAAAQRVGSYAAFDLAHAAGNVPLKLHDWGVDFAVWCNYKYLNAGPGAIGGMFVHQKHFGKSRHQFNGWWGHDLSTRFSMRSPFSPILGAQSYRLSNPDVLSVISLLGSLEIFHDAGMSNLREKSILLTGYMELLIQKLLNTEDRGNNHQTWKILTPSDPQQRGCQLSFELETTDMTKDISQQLKEAGIVCDVRKPAVIRISPTPLYNTFCDVYHAIQVLSKATRKITN